jgi:hypothetical protein
MNGVGDTRKQRTFVALLLHVWLTSVACVRLLEPVSGLISDVSACLLLVD